MELNNDLEISYYVFDNLRLMDMHCPVILSTS